MDRKANAFINNLMDEGVGVNVFETGLDASTNSGLQVGCRAQTAWSVKQTGMCASLSF